MEKQDENQENKELLYLIAYGYHRRGRSYEANEYLDRLLTIEPNHQLAISLRTLVQDKSSLTAKVGFLGVALMVGTAVMAYKSGMLGSLKNWFTSGTNK